jgi:hypothetical protein
MKRSVPDSEGYTMQDGLIQIHRQCIAVDIVLRIVTVTVVIIPTTAMRLVASIRYVSHVVTLRRHHLSNQLLLYTSDGTASTRKYNREHMSHTQLLCDVYSIILNTVKHTKI